MISMRDFFRRLARNAVQAAADAGEQTVSLRSENVHDERNPRVYVYYGGWTFGKPVLLTLAVITLCLIFFHFPNGFVPLIPDYHKDRHDLQTLLPVGWRKKSDTDTHISIDNVIHVIRVSCGGWLIPCYPSSHVSHQQKR